MLTDGCALLRFMQIDVKVIWAKFMDTKHFEMHQYQSGLINLRKTLLKDDSRFIQSLPPFMDKDSIAAKNASA
jgi:hypothetical protein